MVGNYVQNINAVGIVSNTFIMPCGSLRMVRAFGLVSFSQFGAYIGLKT